MKDLADFIIKRIGELNITQSELAKRVGVSKKSIQNIINGHVLEIKLSTAISLAKALQVHPIYIVKLMFKNINISYTKTRSSTPLYQGDDSRFIEDVTIPDDTEVYIGSSFKKIWRIQNVGKIEWEKRKLICTSNYKDFNSITPLKAEYLLPLTRQGETIDIEIEFEAPIYPCTTISVWKMVDKENQLCFPKLQGIYCKVKVIDF